jgi:16S rRNA (guanine527-N7)-methyltransferase
LTPNTAAAVFGDRLELAQRYADRLTVEGIEQGLLGPREADRIWDRHLLNCAVVTDLLPLGARVVDIGSGAGLPGLVFACRRPDLQVDLVESLQRRVRFLTETVTLLGLADRVRVVLGRAEDDLVRASVGNASWVTARAVAPLDRLVGWALPLLESGGRLLAIKGARAQVEVDEHVQAVKRAGGELPRLLQCGADVLAEPVTVIEVRKRTIVKDKKGRRTT